MDGFAQHILSGQFWQLLQHVVSIFVVGADVDMVDRNHLAQPIEGGLQKRPAGRKEIQKLLGMFAPTARPKPSSSTASQDDTIVVVLNVHKPNLQMIDSISIISLLRYTQKTESASFTPYFSDYFAKNE